VPLPPSFGGSSAAHDFVPFAEDEGRNLHAASDDNYGSRNIHAELSHEGTRVGRKRIALDASDRH
jgi:hypothetical protein